VENQFFIYGSIGVMKKRLSPKERKEAVTKGFLEDVGYITEQRLEEILESKNYVTKDWAQDMFETFQKSITDEFSRQTGALIEAFRHENRLVIESLESRIERIERFAGLSQI
jgi:hypothetical protein